MDVAAGPGGMAQVAVNGAELDVITQGAGEPVLLIQTALLAEELAPLADRLALHRGYSLIRYHRRGYGRSSAVTGPGSIERDAADGGALLRSLGVHRAHVVGLSFSCAIALELAVAAPELVHSLVLLEPPPLGTPSEPEFRTACRTLAADYRSRGPAAAVDAFLTRIVGPDWRTVAAAILPATDDRLHQGMTTFVETDVPALLAWRFDASDAERVTQPVLYIGGAESGTWFDQARELMLRRLPQAEHVTLTGADHSFATTHPGEVATALHDFLRRHPIRPGRSERRP